MDLCRFFLVLLRFSPLLIWIFDDPQFRGKKSVGTNVILGEPVYQLHCRRVDLSHVIPDDLHGLSDLMHWQECSGGDATNYRLLMIVKENSNKVDFADRKTDK